jgi:predicted metal-dependent peptidase
MSINDESPALTKIRKARLKLLFNFTFFGNLVMKLPEKDATDAGWCDTAAVDGRNIYYNRNYIDDLSVEETTFVFAHEVLHVVFDHFGRRSHRDPQWWNMACDYVINATLIQEGIGKMPEKKVDVKDSDGKATQRVGLYDSKYIGWSSEAVYDDLEKRKVKKQLTLDVHIEMGKDAQDGAGKKSNNGIPIDIDEESLKEIRAAMKDKILESAAASQGRLPASIARLLDQLVEPKINWRDYIRETIQSQLTSDYTWHKPSRRNQNADVILPSLQKEEQIDVEVTIDQSGSISKEMAMDFVSEVYGITQQYAQFTIGVSTFDTELYNRQVFTNENVDEMLEYTPMGGGGTDFNAFWNYYKKNDINPKLLIVFTDLECYDHGPPNYCDNVIWLVNNPHNKDIFPQFGTWVRYDRAEGVVDTGSV